LSEIVRHGCEEGLLDRAGLLVVGDIGCGAYLFLIRGLIVLIAAALLGCLAGLVLHRIGLAGLIPLLRLIRLVLLCHGAAPDISRRFFVRVQRC
jgi:hypothetical protein